MVPADLLKLQIPGWRTKALTHMSAQHGGRSTYGDVWGSQEVEVHQLGLRRTSRGRRVRALHTETGQKGPVSFPRAGTSPGSPKGLRANVSGSVGHAAVLVRVAVQRDV